MLLVWDFDGTLADTFAGIHLCMNDTLAQHGHEPVSASTLRPLIGLNLRLVFARLLGDDALATDDPELIQSLVDSYRAINNRISPDHATLYPGIAALLGELDERGVPSAIATSKGRTGVLRTLDRLGIRGRFFTVVSDDDVEQKKPNPEMVLKACEAGGYEPAEATVIGDTVFDMEMGRRADAETCGVTWGNQTRDQLATQEPTHVVDTVDELAKLLA